MLNHFTFLPLSRQKLYEGGLVIAPKIMMTLPGIRAIGPAIYVLPGDGTQNNSP